MTASRSVDPALRYGEVSARWGNLAAPAGELAVGETFTFAGEEGLHVVRRVLDFPPDCGKRLFHSETVTG